MEKLFLKTQVLYTTVPGSFCCGAALLQEGVLYFLQNVNSIQILNHLLTPPIDHRFKESYLKEQHLDRSRYTLYSDLYVHYCWPLLKMLV